MNKLFSIFLSVFIANSCLCQEQQKSAFIVGFTGKIGKALINILDKENYNYIGLFKATDTKGNLNTPEITHFLKEIKPDHLYLLSHIDKSTVGKNIKNINETYKINAELPERILDAVYQLKLKTKVILRSSLGVFTGNKAPIYDKNSPIFHSSNHGMTHIGRLSTTREYRNKGVFASCAIIPDPEFNDTIFDTPETLTKDIAQYVMSNSNVPLKIQNYTDISGCWLSAENIAKGMFGMACIEKPDDHILAGKKSTVKDIIDQAFYHAGNIKSGKPIKLFWLCDKGIVKALDVSDNLNTKTCVEVEPGTRYDTTIIGNPELAQWEPEVTFSDFIKDMVEKHMNVSQKTNKTT
jgi:GDP-D-mannose dehydratase